VNIGINAALLSLGSTYRATGLSNYISYLLHGLGQVDQSNRYTVYTGAWARDPEAQRQLALGRNFHLSTTRVPTHYPPTRFLWEQTAHALATRKMDVIHSPVNVIPLLARRPRVVTIHDLAFLLFQDSHLPTKRLYLRLMTRLSARFADAIVTVSENTRRDVIRLLNADPAKVITVPNAADKEYQWLGETQEGEREVEAFRVRRGLPERYFLYLGTLEPRKNIPQMLRAYAGLHGQESGAAGRAGLPKLVLAGPKGWMYQEIFDQVRSLGLEEYVLFPGFIPREEIVWWYNAALAFVYLSAYEGFGLPPLQAMACGVPVIINDASALPEVAGSAGCLVSAGETEAVTQALCEVAESQELRRSLREKGLARASEFSWERTAMETLAVYEAVHQGSLQR